jgi:hypothetical protein
LEELSSFNDQEPPSDGPGERENKPSFPYKTLIVNDPIANRDQILSFAKGQLGVYIWTHSKSLDTLYVGHSVSLYNRISSYFMPSILKTKARRVLSYFNKYGFSEVQLTIHVLDKTKYNVSHAIELEQYFMDKLRPRLNVDPIAAGSGTRGETSQEAILRGPRRGPEVLQDL